MPHAIAAGGKTLNLNLNYENFVFKCKGTTIF